MEERNERDARVTRSNQEHFHSIIKIVVFVYNCLSYSEKEKAVTARRHFAELFLEGAVYSGIGLFGFFLECFRNYRLMSFRV